MTIKTSELGGGGGIKSIQRGNNNITPTNNSATVTITAVDITKSFVSATGTSGETAAYGMPRAYLTDSTTLTLARNNTSNTATVSWEVIEYA